MKTSQKKATGQQGALEVRLNRALEELGNYKSALQKARSDLKVECTSLYCNLYIRLAKLLRHACRVFLGGGGGGARGQFPLHLPQHNCLKISGMYIYCYSLLTAPMPKSSSSSMVREVHWNLKGLSQ